MNFKNAAATVAAIGAIGGSALALDKLHVASEDFDAYIEQRQAADDRNYVRALKEDIRNVSQALQDRPGDSFLTNELLSLIDELCEYRPSDRMCSGG